MKKSIWVRVQKSKKTLTICSFPNVSNVSKISIPIIQWALCNVHFALLPYISDYKGNIPVKKDNLLKVFSDWGPDFHIMFDVQITSDDWDSSDISLRNVLQFTRSGHFLMFYFRFYWLALQKLFEKPPLLFSSLLKTSLLKHWTSCATSITLQASCFENWFPCFARVLNSSRGIL